MHSIVFSAFHAELQKLAAAEPAHLPLRLIFGAKKQPPPRKPPQPGEPRFETRTNDKGIKGDITKFDLDAWPTQLNIAQRFHSGPTRP